MPSVDDKYINYALGLALNGKQGAHPNPMVGCVIVKSGRVVGRGYHRQFGGPHAEINALRMAGARAKGATVYVTLEPCFHTGKTPPCVNALIQSKVSRVVIAVQDPNPAVKGKSIHVLKKAGIKVKVGLAQDAARQINRPFFKLQTTGLPFVTLKTAMTFDGKIASAQGHSRWISGPVSRSLVHRLRGEVDAVLVGTETARNDNPALTSHGAGRNPVRVVLDKKSKLPLTHKVFKGPAKTVVLCGKNPPPSRQRVFDKRGITSIPLPSVKGKFSARQILRALGKIGAAHVLVEGGGETAWPFIKEKLVDEYVIFLAPKILGGSKAKTPVGGAGFRTPQDGPELEIMSLNRLGSDILIKARPKGRAR